MNTVWSRIWPSDLLAFQNNPKAIPMLPGEFDHVCINCGGHEMMMVFIIESGPYQQPSKKGDKWMDLTGMNFGKGWFHGKLETSPCPVCQENQLETYLMHNCGLSDSDLYKTISNFKVSGVNEEKLPAKRVVENLFSQNRDVSGFVSFYGNYGVGKSHLLKSIINGFRAIKVLSRYTTMADLLAEIQERFGSKDGISAENVIENYRKARVLCIDEIDKINPTNWAYSTMFRLLDSRYNEKDSLLTVLASNLSPRELPPEMGYLASRFIGGIVVHVAGEDMRPAEGLRATKALTSAAAIHAANEAKESIEDPFIKLATSNLAETMEMKY
jgi:DNA replication protein DnaC